MNCSYFAMESRQTFKVNKKIQKNTKKQNKKNTKKQNKKTKQKNNKQAEKLKQNENIQTSERRIHCTRSIKYSKKFF